jgi:hypothetical protein
MKNRRGISTVVGALFFIIIFMTTISYVTYDMNLLNNFANAFVIKSQADADANHEAFSITKVTIDNNKFNITVQNSGNIPVNINRLWIQNKTDITWGTSKYDINQIVYPGNSLTKIGQSLPLYAKSTQGYDIKLVTTRGNIKEFFVNSVSQEPVYLQLFTLPNYGPNNFNTTLLFSVTNNMTNAGDLSNVQPNIVVTNTTGKAILISSPSPAVYPLLKNGDAAFFQWKYKITGANGQVVNFKLSLKNGYLNNFVTQNVTLINTTNGINIGHGGKGVYSSTVGTTLQLRNITSANTNHLTVNSNATDILIDTGSTLLNETAEKSQAPLAGGTSTVPNSSLRWYQFYTMPATEKFYLITGIEWINKGTVNGNVQCGVDRVDAIPPVSASTPLLAFSSTVAQAGTNAVQRNSAITSEPIKAGTLVGAWCQSSSATATFGTTAVANANNRKTIAFTSDPPNQDVTAWTSSATGFSVKLYYVGYK